jgi:hypothetical protein
MRKLISKIREELKALFTVVDYNSFMFGLIICSIIFYLSVIVGRSIN